MRVAMRFRLILPGLVALVTLTSIGVTAAFWTNAPDAPALPQPALPVLIANYSNADRIELRHGRRALWLERRGEVWGLAQAGGYPVRAERAAALVDGLLGLRLDRPVDGTPEQLAVADPDAVAGAGTLVRVLAVSGALLGSIIVGPADGPPYVRRPGEAVVWLASSHLAAGADPLAWTGGRLPPPGNLTLGQGTDTEAMEVRKGVRLGDVRAGPQVHPVAVRSITLGLADGTALLRIGREKGVDWLQISGSAAWARQLSPYAFALAADSALATPR